MRLFFKDVIVFNMPNDASFLYKKSFTGNYFEFAALAVNVVNPNTGWVVTACNNSPQHVLSDKLQVFFFQCCLFNWFDSCVFKYALKL